MPQSLTFTQVNNEFSSPIFSFDNGEITLNLNGLTGDNYTSLDNEGIIEACFKLLQYCWKAQETLNASNANDPLTSFSAPFYGTVANTIPPIIEGSITVTGNIPLDVDNLTGR